MCDYLHSVSFFLFPGRHAVGSRGNIFLLFLCIAPIYFVCGIFGALLKVQSCLQRKHE